MNHLKRYDEGFFTEPIIPQSFIDKTIRELKVEYPDTKQISTESPGIKIESVTEIGKITIDISLEQGKTPGSSIQSKGLKKALTKGMKKYYNILIHVYPSSDGKYNHARGLVALSYSDCIPVTNSLNPHL
jgi:hypothetical protein